MAGLRLIPLRTRLTVFHALVSGVTLLLILLAVHSAMTHNAGHLAPAQLDALLGVILGLGAVGLIAQVAASWVLAGTITRRLSALETAAGRLGRGENTQVEVASEDEIARLARGFNAMARDVRSRQARLERARDLAEAADRAKDALLADLGHELRTPLNDILGVVGVLAGADLDDRQRQMAAIIESSAAALQRVLNEGLDPARMDAGPVDIPAAPALTPVAEAAPAQAPTPAQMEPSVQAQAEPQPEAEVRPAAEAEPEAEAPPARADRVLLADDHATNRQVVRLILESAGIELVAVEDGAQAVETFKAQRFDAVLMDIQMPVMDGLTATRLIRAYERKCRARRTPILVLSANVMPEHLAGSADAGADDHLPKPIVAAALLDAIAGAIRASRAAPRLTLKKKRV